MTIDSRAAGFLLVGVVLAAAALSLGLIGGWLDWVVVSQTGPIAVLPTSDILRDYVTGIFWAVLLGAGVAMWGSAIRFRGPLLVAWTAKAFVALGFMLFYDFRYGVDPDGYFVNASSSGFGFEWFEIGQGTRNTQMLAWLHIQALSSSYHASRLSFALVGLVAVYLIYRAGVICIGREDRRIFYFFAMVPSILFWSSILGKDPISMFAVSAYAYGVVAWYKLGRARYLAWVVIGVLVGVYIRVWLGPIFLIPLTVLGWSRTVGTVRRAAYLSLGLLGVLVSPLVIQETIGVEVVRRDEVLETTNYLARSFEQGGSTLNVPELSTLGDVATFAPLGVFTVLFRPLPGESLNPFGFLASIENVFLLFLALRAAWRTRLKDLREPLVLWALAAVLLWALVYAMGSYQNLGTAIRHRVEILPLMLGLLVYLGRQRSRTTAADARPNRRAALLTRGVR